MAIESNIQLSPAEKDTLLKTLEGHIPNIRDRRKTVTRRMELNHAAWRGTHTRSFFKSDTFAHFIPAARRVVERFVTRGTQMLLPSSEFFEVYPGDELDDDAGKRAESTRAYLVYLFRKKLRTYSLVKQLLRCFLLYSRAIVKTGVRVERSGRETLIWPTARAVDPFMFYTWPETCTNIEDAQIVVEDNMMPWETYAANMKRGVVDSIKREDLTKVEWPHHIIKRLSDQGISTPDDMSEAPQAQREQETKPLQSFLAISEVWMRKETSWWFVWLLWNVDGGPKIVRVSKKLKSRPSYRMVVSREIPGEAYTSAMMDDIEPLQVLLNDQINMTSEAQAVSFSPPTVVDPDRVSRASSIIYKPRAIWYADPEGIKMLEPKDTTKIGFQGIQMTLGLMDTFSGSSPLAEGQPTRNLPRAGFAVSSLLSLSLADIKDAAILMEDEILTPLLGDLYGITLDMIPKSQVFKIPGTSNFEKARKLKPSDLLRDAEFAWVGSIQTQEFQIRSQRLVSLLDTIGKYGEQIGRDLQIKNKQINWTAILKRLWRDGLGERGADSIISDITPQERALLLSEQIAQAQAQEQAANQQAGRGTATQEGGGVDDQTAQALENLALAREQEQGGEE